MPCLMHSMGAIVAKGFVSNFYLPRIVDLSQGRPQRVGGLWRAGQDGNGHTGESSHERSKKTNKIKVPRANCVD